MGGYSTLLIVFLGISVVIGQPTDYIGAGRSQGVTVTASSQFYNTHPMATINGRGMDVPYFKASRFLSQATIGYEKEDISQVLNTGKEGWIEAQFDLAASYITPSMESIWEERKQARAAIGQDPNQLFGPWALDFNYAWWQVNLTYEDLLRQKVAYALSQILVISIFSDLRDYAYFLSDYYDVLIRHSFGNYRDLLYDITRHAAMAFYLSHLNNPKSNPDVNQRPDENFAREIMQLFTIGLFELNIDGTRKLNNGQPIPTYDNETVSNFAKVFTGLGAGAINSNVTWTNQPYFGLHIWGIDPRVPLAMYENFHEPGEKHLLNGYTIPGGQTGLQDISDAIDNLFNHENVGPFIAYRLIQRLVKSNPSPAYVQRVAQAFNGANGGERGDMKNVIRAILLDEEAREDEYISTEVSSRLKEPIMRYTQVARMIQKDSPYGRYWNNGFDSADELKQHPLASPSVFNFYLPEHQPTGTISAEGNVAPEFKIHNTTTSINYINKVNQWIMWLTLMWSWEGDQIDIPIAVDLSQYVPLAEYPDDLINEYDRLYTHGQLTDETRIIIRQALEGITWGNYRWERARLGLYLLLISPDFNTMK